MIRDDVFALAVMAVVFVGCALVEALTKPVATWDEDTPRERARERVMADAQFDDHECHRCRRVSVVRELVMRQDDAVLCCLGCAELIKVTAPTRQETA